MNKQTPCFSIYPIPSGIGSCGLSHNIPFYLTNLTCKMFIAMSHWSSPRPLTHDHHRALTKTSFRYPAVTRTCGDPVAIFPQDKSFHAFQQANDKVDDRVGQQKAQDVALSGS